MFPDCSDCVFSEFGVSSSSEVFFSGKIIFHLGISNVSMIFGLVVDCHSNAYNKIQLNRYREIFDVDFVGSSWSFERIEFGDFILGVLFYRGFVSFKEVCFGVAADEINAIGIETYASAVDSSTLYNCHGFIKGLTSERKGRCAFKVDNYGTHTVAAAICEVRQEGILRLYNVVFYVFLGTNWFQLFSDLHNLYR
ncbi:hypothetical protein LXL04_010822 [Taraxacum kok-saghyz]